MATRIAATLSMIVFAICVIAGMAAENGFSTVIVRALTAMVVTLIVGMILGAMAQRMLDENLAAAAEKAKEKTENAEAAATPDGR